MVSFCLLYIIINSSFVLGSTQIEPDSLDSPIRKYFNKQKILWTFDDYYICYDFPPHRGFSNLTKRIISYGGHVNIMTILFHVNEAKDIKNYSVIDDLGWEPQEINRSLTFFSQEHVYPACHGWDARSELLNNASLEEAYEIINHTLWNWENNFHIQPTFFLGDSTSGNYNITLALKKFSETYWPVYGENFRWDQEELFSPPTRDTPAISYIGKEPYIAMFDPLFGLPWGNPCESLEDSQNLFINQTENKEIIFIRGHPSSLNKSETTPYYSLWIEWIDWIYQNHELTNINHTEAIYYIADREAFKIERQSPDKFIINLSSCSFDHDILFSQPYDGYYYNWTLYRGQKEVASFYDDYTIHLSAGQSYTMETNDKVEIPLEKNAQYKNIYERISGLNLIFLLLCFIVISIFIKKIRNKS